MDDLIFTMSQREMEALHAKATENLERKLAKIPDRIFVHGKPTMADFYYNRYHKIHIDGIPEGYQPKFWFHFYNDLHASNFRARKDKNQTFHAASSIWYYETDRNHNFSQIHDIARYNVLLAIIVSISKEKDILCDPATKDFRETFLTSWLYATIRDKNTDPQEIFLRHWYRSGYEMICFNDDQRGKIRKAIKKLKENVPPMPEAAINDIREFLTGGADKLNTQQLRDHGPAWALQFMMLMEKNGKLFDEMARNKLTQMAEGIEQMFGNIGLGEEHIQLRPEFFQDPVVLAILRDIDEGIVPWMQYTATERAKPWMDPNHAIHVLEGIVADLENLIDSLAKLKFVTE